MNERLIDFSCRVCQRDGAGQRFIAREMMTGTREEFSYVLCPGCGCLQIEEIPKDLARYYQRDYYSHKEQLFSRLLRWWKARWWSTAVGNSSIVGAFLAWGLGPAREAQWISVAGLRAEDRILDVGCGAGQLLTVLDQMGYRYLVGVDPFTGASRKVGPVEILKKEVAAVEGPFDVVMAHHTLEHMQDQKGFFEQAHRLLMLGGRLIIRIPVVDSWAWSEFGVNWVQLDAPRHLYLHSRKSIVELAERSGFRLDQVFFDSTALQLWGSRQYEQNIPLTDLRSVWLSWTSLFSREESEADRLNREGRGDQACFLFTSMKVTESQRGPVHPDTT